MIQEGQIWRKDGPFGWIRVEKIIAPGYKEYDGGLPGATITAFPPQLHGIQCRGGKQFFMCDSPEMTWQNQISHNRFLLKDGWKRGDKICIRELS